MQLKCQLSSARREIKMGQKYNRISSAAVKMLVSANNQLYNVVWKHIQANQLGFKTTPTQENLQKNLFWKEVVCIYVLFNI